MAVEEKSGRKNRRKWLSWVIIIIFALILAIMIAESSLDYDVRYVPTYEKINLRVILAETGTGGAPADESDGRLTDEAYDALFRQTGLGRDAVDKIINKAGSAERARETFLFALPPSKFIVIPVKSPSLST